jgi:hypothetical protein
MSGGHYAFAPEIAEIGRLCNRNWTRVERREGGEGDGMCPCYTSRVTNEFVRDRRNRVAHMPPRNPDDRVKKTYRGYRYDKRPSRVGAFRQVQPSTGLYCTVLVERSTSVQPSIIVISYFLFLSFFRRTRSASNGAASVRAALAN